MVYVQVMTKSLNRNLSILLRAGHTHERQLEKLSHKYKRLRTRTDNNLHTHTQKKKKKKNDVCLPLSNLIKQLKANCKEARELPAGLYILVSALLLLLLFLRRKIYTKIFGGRTA